jgi:hypothetical protein
LIGDVGRSCGDASCALLFALNQAKEKRRNMRCGVE